MLGRLLGPKAATERAWRRRACLVAVMLLALAPGGTSAAGRSPRRLQQAAAPGGEGCCRPFMPDLAGTHWSILLTGRCLLQMPPHRYPP